ncbi:MAG: hypothetical protein R3F11_18550 [Verrucomicrobiales bacterium]
MGRLRESLRAFREGTAACFAAFVDGCGSVLCADGDETGGADAIGALASGAIGSAQALAGMLGDQGDGALLYQGRIKSFYVVPVGGDLVLAAAFSTRAAPIRGYSGLPWRGCSVSSA